ncbi:hypothetical protein ABFX02_02G114200 [Erythranthe guttata]
MKIFQMLVTLFSLLLTCCVIATWASSYDYSASIDCLEKPWTPQYNGGLVGNSEFDLGLDEWSKFGNGKIELRKSKSGNNYMAACDRKMPNDSFSYILYVEKEFLYTFSAWFQLNKGKEIISAYLKHGDGTSTIVGSVIAKFGCWSMLKGGFQMQEDMNAQLYFMSNNTEVELWIDNASLEAFTKAEWRDQQYESINKVRKQKVRIHVMSQDGLKLEGAKVTIDQTRPRFHIGGGTTSSIIDNKAYQDYFVKRFTAATFDNEMKWYYTEAHQGLENYTVPDAMVSFFKQNGIAVRGHTILWASVNMNQQWVKALAPRDVLKAAVRRVGSIVSRYSGDIIGWDVVNENMHNSFYEDRIGRPDASAMFYQIVRALDPQTPLFLNEYNILAHPTDMKVIPSKYVEKIREIRAFPGNEDLVLRIGLQGHFFFKPNVSHIRASLDVLGATNLPIWLTEMDFKRGPTQHVEFEEVMREVFSHPAVEGIIVWAGWKPTSCSDKCLSDKNYDVLPEGCSMMCLTDINFKNLPTGDALDKLVKEWKTINVTGFTDNEGVFEHEVFLGDYSLTYSHPSIPRTVKTVFNVTGGREPLDVRVSS